MNRATASTSRRAMPCAAKVVTPLATAIRTLAGYRVRGTLRSTKLGKERRGSRQKAFSQLGWTTRPVEQTLLDTATSLAAVGGLERQ